MHHYTTFQGLILLVKNEGNRNLLDSKIINSNQLNSVEKSQLRRELFLKEI